MNPSQLLLALLLLTAPAFASTPVLEASGAKVRLLAGGFRFTEGPACDREGNVYFCDIPNNRINVWKWTGDLSLHRDNSGGANGMHFDADGSLVICESGNRRVTRENSQGQITVLADKFEGKRLNSPNDLWISPTGGIYFSDPRYGKADDLELPTMQVYYLPPGGKPLRCVTTDLKRPNGLVGTPDGKKLYIADEGAGKVWSYDIARDGSLRNQELFVEQACDGMTLDELGNVYLACNKVLIYSPTGQLLEQIPFPEQPSNLVFGGKDRKTLYVTARSSLYSLDMSVAGAHPPEPAKTTPVKNPVP